MVTLQAHDGLRPEQAFVKRGFDLALASIALLLSCWIIALAWVAATIDTGENGMFVQERVGKNGKLFRVLKIRTMRSDNRVSTNVTTTQDSRITRLGRILRAAKIDELPQLINVVLGHMSLVGPRPDVPGFADCLEGEDRIILSIRPGITGPATLRYRDEQTILAGMSDPEFYNREILYPDKVRINRAYIGNWSLRTDVAILIRTVFG